MSIWTRPLAVTAISSLLAAQPPSDRVEFEVVSIKPADPAAPGHIAQRAPGGFRGQNLRLFELIMSAWNLNRDQIIGGPKWLDTAGWDIDARSPNGSNPAKTALMMQALLADRFRLITHKEHRILPIYVLAAAKGGRKLSAGDGRGAMSAGPRLIKYSSATMGELARELSSYLGREVVDRTGLTGQYAIDLSFAPIDPGAATETSAPSIFQALLEQAGLKLEAETGPVEVLIIDQVERATPN
jgi:uncharacterized protein (TIGR03435 family)